jgi:hypothetical protein
MTLSRNDEAVYWDLMKCKTGGLSIVHNRKNIAGVDTINRLKLTPKGKIYLNKTKNIITHIIGVDFNSLYPTAFSSVKLSYLDKPIPLPAAFQYTIFDKQKIMKYVEARASEKQSDWTEGTCFFVSVRGHCVVSEETLNFPPVIRNVSITTNRETIGDYTYNYMKANGIKTDQPERKLTQMLDSHNEFHVFYSVYLYFLIDTCGFVIDDVERLHVFSSHTSFKEFATQTMTQRQKAILEKDKVRDLFNKIALNGSYGYDLLN